MEEVYIKEKDLYEIIQKSCLEDDEDGRTELEKLFYNSTLFSQKEHSKDYYQAMQQGMIFALIIAGAKCPKYVIKI